MQIKDRVAPFRRAAGFLKPHRPAVGGILFLTLLTSAFGAVEPILLKYVFDGIGRPGAVRVLVHGIAGLLVLGLVREGANAFSNTLTWKTRLRVHYSLLEATVGRLHRLPLSFHKTEGVGALMTRLDRGIQGFVGALTDVAFNVLPALVYLVISVVVMVRLEWRLALVVLAFAPLPAIIAATAAPSQTRRERMLLNRWAGIYSRFNEVLSGIHTVKSFAMEDAEKHRFLQAVSEVNEVVSKGVRTDSGIGAAQNTVVTLARVAAIAFGGLLAVRGQLTLGTLVAFLGYVGGLFGPVQGLSSVYRTLRVASVSLRQVFSILDAHDEVADGPNAADAPRLRGAVEFRNVSFAYDPLRPPILEGIDLRVEPNQTIALVGPSGAGKTTLMALLQRFNDPSSGAVRVDGIDVRALKQRSLRGQIGVVLQDALLFNDTIGSNIAYGRPDASRAEIEEAARAANAHEFITNLSQGYDTPVGERGGRLSGGERQRIAIARALLKDPPILILDEATSALDAESETLIQQALARLCRQRTTFIIAHRLATVVHADRILVLRNGRIEESGTHRELMAGEGYYARVVEQQIRGFLKKTSKGAIALDLSRAS